MDRYHTHARTTCVCMCQQVLLRCQDVVVPHCMQGLNTMRLLPAILAPVGSGLS
jgi:hypothetical protein